MYWVDPPEPAATTQPAAVIATGVGPQQQGSHAAAAAAAGSNVSRTTHAQSAGGAGASTPAPTTRDSSSMTQAQAKQQHWTLAALQQLQRYSMTAAKSAVASGTAAAAAAAAASAAAAAAGRGAYVNAGTPGQQQEPLPQHTEQYSSRRSSSTGPPGGGAAAVTAADSLLGSICGATLTEEQQQQQAAAALEAAEKHAAATAARAAAADAAAATAAWEWQQAVRLACYTTEQGLMDLQQLVTCLVKCLNSKSNSSSSHKLRETALLLAEVAAEQIYSCQPLVANLGSCLVTLVAQLDLADARQGTTNLSDSSKQAVTPSLTQQGGGAKGTAARGSSAGGSSSSTGSGTSSNAVTARLRYLASQLLQRLLLLAPASLTSLDCLPQLCKVLLGPAAAHGLLYEHSCCSSACFAPSSGSSSGGCGSSGSSTVAQQLQNAPAGVVGSLQSVLSMSRQMAAAVSPRYGHHCRLVVAMLSPNNLNL